jgi:hypothetical protein
MLVDVMRNATSGVAERYKRFCLAARRGGQVISALVSKSLLSSDFVATPAGRVRFLQVTERGADALTKLGYDYKIGRRGGPEHEYWKHRVGETLRDAGFQIEFEYRLKNGESIDLVARANNKTYAIEIETGKSDVQHNVRRNLDLDFDKVICISLSIEVIDMLQASFSTELAKGSLKILTIKLLDSVASEFRI